MADYAAALAGLIDALALGPSHLLGHSWGSTVALELYRKRPQLVASLILAGGYAGWAGSLDPDEVARRLAFGLEVANRLPGGFDPPSMRGLFSEAMPVDRREELMSIMSEIRPAGTRTMAHALAEADLRDMLATVEVPTLLLYGDADERSPLPVAEALHAAIPTSRLVVLPGLGHEAYLESSSTFDAEVRTFLQSITSKGRASLHTTVRGADAGRRGVAPVLGLGQIRPGPAAVA